MEITKQYRDQVASAIAGGIASLQDMSALGADFVLTVKSSPTTQQRRMCASLPKLKGNDIDSRTLSFVASTEAVDRMGDIIRVKGWELANYTANPIVLFNHNQDWPIGTGQIRKGEISGGKRALLNEITFADKDGSPLGDQIFHLSRKGVLRGNSVGFWGIESRRPTAEERKTLGLSEFSMIFERSELFEDSVVSVPANPEAVRRSLSELVNERVLSQDQADVFAREAYSAEPSDWFGIARKTVVALGSGIIETLRSMGDLDVPPASEDQRMPDAEVPFEPVLRSFDVAAAHLEVARTEHDWAARFCDCEVKELHSVGTGTDQMDAASFFDGLDLQLAGAKVADVRNIDHENREVPPVTTVFERGSEDTCEHLTSGLRFLHLDGVPLVLKVRDTWGGINVTVYSKSGSMDTGNLLSNAWAWANENHYRRGKAFSLLGRYLKSSDTAWTDAFLTRGVSEVVQKSIQNIVTKGANAPSRGMIWQGPPGTGKTLTARIMRNETRSAGVTLVWCTARDFNLLGTNGGLTRAFDMARRFAPAIVLLEDVDGWIRHGHDLLKTEMDGFEESRGVVTILTTNHPEQLPKALIDRPGRFHDVINFDLPDESIRKAMFSKWAPDIDAKTLEVAVAGSEGMSGAHVYELCSFAKGLSEFDEVSASEAMERALRKLTEQRELLGVHQKGFDLLQRRPSGGGGGDSKAITQALTNLVAAQTAQTEAQTEQMVVTRQLLDTIQDLSRKVVSIHAPSEPTGSGAGGDSGDDFETDAVLRIVSAYGQVQV